MKNVHPSIQCWDLNPWPSGYECHPISTRPGLPPTLASSCFLYCWHCRCCWCWCCCWCCLYCWRYCCCCYCCCCYCCCCCCVCCCCCCIVIAIWYWNKRGRKYFSSVQTFSFFALNEMNFGAYTLLERTNAKTSLFGTFNAFV